MSNFPTELDPLLPTPGAGESLGGSSPTHPEHHTELEARTRAIQLAVGKSGSADTASIEYRLAGVIAAADAAASAAADAAADAISALANAALASSDLADHEADTGAHDIAATVATAIAAHESALDPHGGYALEVDLGTAAFIDAGTAVGDLVQVQAGGALPALDASALLNLPASGVTDHGALTGLADDDHTQYHTDARGDARYAPIAKGVTGGDSHNHDGGDGAQIAYASLSGLPTLGTAAAAATGDFEAAGTVSTHNAVATAHGISAWGATLVDDADDNTARSTLGLSSVDNTSDAGKPVSTAQQTALNLKANLASPTFTGTVGGITAAMVGAPSGSGTSTGTNTGDSATPAETTTTIGALLNGATSKTTPVDADQIGLMDSVASNILKKLSWANLKTALSGLFVLLDGKAGGQTITGGTAASENLTLVSTSHATKGRVYLGTNSAYNHANDRLGLGTTSGTDTLDILNGAARVRDANSGFRLVTSGGVNYIQSAAAGMTGSADFRITGMGGNPILGVFTATGDLAVNGAASASAKIHAISTTEQLRLGYDAANYCKSLVNSVGVSRVDLVGTAPAIIHAVSDATTNSVYNVSTLSKNSIGAGAAGLGVRQVLAAKSSTTNDVQQAAISSEWLVATHATRAVRGEFGGWDYSGYRTGFTFEADGTQIKTSVNGVPAAARAAALTAEIPGDATRDELRLTELYNACKNFGIIN